MTPATRAGSIVAAIKAVQPMIDHAAEIAVLLLVRDAIEADRHECAMEQARGATSLLDAEKNNERVGA